MTKIFIFLFLYGQQEWEENRKNHYKTLFIITTKNCCENIARQIPKKKKVEKIYNLQKIKDQAPHYFIQSFKHLKNIELEHLNKQWRGNLTIYMIFWESNGVELGMPILSTDFFNSGLFQTLRFHLLTGVLVTNLSLNKYDIKTKALNKGTSLIFIQMASKAAVIKKMVEGFNREDIAAILIPNL